MTRPFKSLRKGETHTLATIHERCIEEGECWIWQAGTSSGSPALRHNGVVMQVRRYIIESLQGRTIPKGRLVSICCENLRCVAPNHIGVFTRRQLQTQTAARTQYAADPVRNARIARSKQDASHLDWPRVREIRAMEGTDRGIARDIGLSYTVVNSIRKHHTWREITNPFGGLLR